MENEAMPRSTALLPGWLFAAAVLFLLATALFYFYAPSGEFSSALPRPSAEDKYRILDELSSGEENIPSADDKLKTLTALEKENAPVISGEEKIRLLETMQ